MSVEALADNPEYQIIQHCSIPWVVDEWKFTVLCNRNVYFIYQYTGKMSTKANKSNKMCAVLNVY